MNDDVGNGRIGVAAMIDAGMARRMTCSRPRSPDPRAVTKNYRAGAIERVPQGAPAERAHVASLAEAWVETRARRRGHRIAALPCGARTVRFRGLARVRGARAHPVQIEAI